MQFITKNQTQLSILILVALTGITLFVFNKTLNSNIETRYAGYTIDENQNVYDNLASIPDFSIFLDNSTRTNLDTVLKNEQNLLVFAATNESFSTISPEDMTKLQSPELLHKLRKIVSLHIIKLPPEQDLNKLKELTTLEGQVIRISSVDTISTVRDSVGNSFEFDNAIYKSSNGYFIKLENVLLPTNISFVNGIQIEADNDIVKNVKLFAGEEKLSDLQDNLLKSDNITYLFTESIVPESDIEDFILVGKFSTFQLAGMPSVLTANGKTLAISVDGPILKVGELEINSSYQNIESKNGFIHFAQ